MVRFGKPHPRSANTLEREDFVEKGAIVLAGLLLAHFERKQITRVVRRGSRVDYFVGERPGDFRWILEVSGTDAESFVGRRREKSRAAAREHLPPTAPFQGRLCFRHPVRPRRRNRPGCDSGTSLRRNIMDPASSERNNSSGKSSRFGRKAFTPPRPQLLEMARLHEERRGSCCRPATRTAGRTCSRPSPLGARRGSGARPTD